MTEFIDIHVRKIHGEASLSPSSATAGSDLRGCPECGEELKNSDIIKHCKIKHKVKLLNVNLKPIELKLEALKNKDNTHTILSM